MTRAGGRTQDCTREEARGRQGQAKKFLEVADLVASEPESASVSASLAVLAGIAASDAACCRALGRRSRSQDHHDAEALVKQIEPGGAEAANQLRRLINLKDQAHYGLFDVSGSDLQRAIRQAKRLVDFADQVLQR
jgi:hypothetical protein